MIPLREKSRYSRAYNRRRGDLQGLTTAKGIRQRPDHNSTEPGFIHSFKINPVPFLLTRSSQGYGSRASTLSPVLLPFGNQVTPMTQGEKSLGSHRQGGSYPSRDANPNSKAWKTNQWAESRGVTSPRILQPSRESFQKAGVRKRCDLSGPEKWACSKKLRENQKILYIW